MQDYGVEDISKLTKLSPMTVRHHLSELERAGLINKRETTIKLAGRPKIVYKANEDEVHVCFPNRDYGTIQQVFTRTLHNYFKTKTELYEFYILIAKEFAEEIMKPYETEGSVVIWDLDIVRDKLIMEAFNKLGAVPEIIKEDQNSITYRLHNCPFTNPKAPNFEFMCSTISRAFLSEISRKIGIPGIEIIKTRLTKPYFCEFKIHRK
jgi:predicted ArsR family transcriptional regulator